MINIVILHGWGSSSQKWQKVKEILANRGFNVITPDLPGFGKSSPLPKPWNVNDYAEWLSNFCEKKNLSQIFLLGHSFGGRIAVKFSVKYPDKISGLILSGAPAIRDEVNIKYITGKALAKFSSRFSFIPFYQSFRKLFYRYFLGKTDYLKVEGMMKETFKLIVAEDLSSFLPEIKMKTLILWGDKDEFVPVKVAHLVKDRVLNSKLIVFPGIGHNLNREMPEKLSETLIDFIENKF